jgi:hypothetical protein
VLGEPLLKIKLIYPSSTKRVMMRVCKQERERERANSPTKKKDRDVEKHISNSARGHLKSGAETLSVVDGQLRQRQHI